MASYTINERETGRCRVHKNTGGRPFWCSFEYIIEPPPLDTACDVEIGKEPDAETQRWFPHVASGIRQGLADLTEHYNVELQSIKIRISRVISHPIATDETACVSYGRSWIVGFGRGDSLVPVSTARDENSR
jgi:hypothetical protein